MVNWPVILGAAAAMACQDILATIMVVSESKGRAHLAATMDTLEWFCQITCTAVSVVTLTTGSWDDRGAVVIAVSIANYAGTYTGTRLGHRLTRDRPP